MPRRSRPHRRSAQRNLSTVVIDEIQKVPGLFDDVQYFFDKYPGEFDFFLTGSSARRKLKTNSSNLLPGRTHLFHMTPVFQAEQRSTEILPLPMKGCDLFPMRSIEEILVYGSLPGLYNGEADSWKDTVKTIESSSHLL